MIVRQLFRQQVLLGCGMGQPARDIVNYVRDCSEVGAKIFRNGMEGAGGRQYAPDHS
jgi:hypothetical protein